MRQLRSNFAKKPPKNQNQPTNPKTPPNPYFISQSAFHGLMGKMVGHAQVCLNLHEDHWIMQFGRDLRRALVQPPA